MKYITVLKTVLLAMPGMLSAALSLNLESLFANGFEADGYDRRLALNSQIEVNERGIISIASGDYPYAGNQYDYKQIIFTTDLTGIRLISEISESRSGPGRYNQLAFDYTAVQFSENSILLPVEMEEGKEYPFSIYIESVDTGPTPDQYESFELNESVLVGKGTASLMHREFFPIEEGFDRAIGVYLVGEWYKEPYSRLVDQIEKKEEIKLEGSVDVTIWLNSNEEIIKIERSISSHELGLKGISYPFFPHEIDRYSLNLVEYQNSQNERLYGSRELGWVYMRNPYPLEDNVFFIYETNRWLIFEYTGVVELLAMRGEGEGSWFYTGEQWIFTSSSYYPWIYDPFLGWCIDSAKS